MPLIHKIYTANQGIILLWEIVESIPQLLSLLPNPDYWEKEIENLGANSRKAEWLSTRILLYHYFPHQFPAIAYNEYGKPFLLNSSYSISISHSKSLVAIFLNPLKKIAIDLEIVHPRINKITNKFLNETEYQFEFCEPDELGQWTLLWSAKETMYKYYAQKELAFKQIFIQASEKKMNTRNRGILSAMINVEPIAICNVHYFRFGNCYLTYCIES